MSGAPGIVRLDVAASTNDEALKLAREGAPSGTAVQARRQTAGRGRRGRSWVSPAAGNLYMSLVHRSALPAASLSGLTLDVASAVADVLDGHGVQVGLKWPNDLLLAGLKVGGVLCELHTGLGDGPVVIVGIGLNVGLEAVPSELEGIATSLKLAAGLDLDADALADEVAAELRATLARYEGAGRPDLERYRRRFALRGRRVALPDGAEGAAKDVAADGGLVVEVDGEERTVRAGEVRLLEG